MCTAVSVAGVRPLFGRTLDVPHGYGEQVVVCPRHFPIRTALCGTLSFHHALIGMAHVADGRPLFYDAANEYGLCAAALNFPGFCRWHEKKDGFLNLAPHDLIPFVLGQCKTVDAARQILVHANLCALPFSPTLPLTPLHFMLADGRDCLVIESTTDGLHIYDNPVRVMTNSPPFKEQLRRLSAYAGLTVAPVERRFPGNFSITQHSHGIGAFGLPGDFSSTSRFVRAAFVLGASEETGDPVQRFFHILESVCVPRGCVRLENGESQYTVYTSCIDVIHGIYYYKTYENSDLSAVSLRCEDLSGDVLHPFSLMPAKSVTPQNG